MPNPEKNPDSNPLFIVLLISTMPIGPGGMETASPRIIPFKSISIAGIIFPDNESKYNILLSGKNVKNFQQTQKEKKYCHRGNTENHRDPSVAFRHLPQKGRKKSIIFRFFFP